MRERHCIASYCYSARLSHKTYKPLIATIQPYILLKGKLLLKYVSTFNGPTYFLTSMIIAGHVMFVKAKTTTESASSSVTPGGYW